MIRSSLLLLCAALLCALAPAQQPAPHKPKDPLFGLRPFRHPDGTVQVPRNVFDMLQAMWRISHEPGKYEVGYDEEGREYCTDPDWKRIREQLKEKMFNVATSFGLVLRDSGNVNDRRLSVYGTFYCDDPQQVMQLIAFFPGEPVREIREDGYRRAIAFLRVHLPKNREPEEGAPDKNPQPLYEFEAGPYVALLDVDDPRDQAQGLWFLGELCSIRPDGSKTVLFHAKKRLRELLVSDSAEVKHQARFLLQSADPEHRKPPADEAGDDEVLAWLDAVLYDVFPPIRVVSSGRTDLYPSHDLDRIVEVGRDVLQNNSIGESYQGKMKNGLFYRGYRIARVPDELKKLRIPVDSVIIAVNGVPVTSAERLLEVVTDLLKRNTVLLVEYVYKGADHMMEFRLQQ